MSSPPFSPQFLLLALGPVFLVTMFLEIWLTRKAHPERFFAKDSINNVVLALLQQGSEFGFLALNWLSLANLYQWLFENGLRWVPSEVNFKWFVVLFVFQDFLYYIFHRTSHRVRWFWSAHVAHHSSGYLNFSTALRQSVLYPFTGNGLFYLPIAWVGFSPEWIAFSVSLNLGLQFFVHTEAVKTLGPLEWILNTPSHHRVHHAKNSQYIDRNYAGVLIIWDRLLGTFVKEQEPPIYGITKDIDFTNPFESNFREFLDMCRGAWSAKSISKKLKWVFYPPEWRE